jgi:hypothetical protein
VSRPITRFQGVLTKPDRIPAGEEQSWLKFIRNEKEPLQNKWFCVKQPASNDLKNNWTWEHARMKEDEFFAATSPWNELEAMYVRYLRTKNLVERLSQVLSDLIAKTYAKHISVLRSERNSLWVFKTGYQGFKWRLRE